MVGTGRGAQLGIVIRGPEVLESTHAVDTIVLDKTGTVTHRPDVRSSRREPADDEVLRLAAAVEQASEHPVARAVVDAAASRGCRRSATSATSPVWEPAALSRVARSPSAGSTCSPPRPTPYGAWSPTAGDGTPVVVGWEGVAQGVLVVADAVKPTSADAVRRLHALGLRTVLLTGDHEATAARVAGEVGIDTVIAGVRPEGKVEAVQTLQTEGRVVAMAGDGVNDAAALAQADLGLAMGTGADVAIAASDLTLVGGDLSSAVTAIRLARRTLATIRGNLFWAFAYNVAAIPLAAAGLLDPMVAGAAMAGSSLFVVGNSLRLRRFR